MACHNAASALMLGHVGYSIDYNAAVLVDELVARVYDHEAYSVGSFLSVPFEETQWNWYSGQEK
jgi:hypothetical protein